MLLLVKLKMKVLHYDMKSWFFYLCVLYDFAIWYLQVDKIHNSHLWQRYSVVRMDPVQQRNTYHRKALLSLNIKNE